jgi:hypothetical protein
VCRRIIVLCSEDNIKNMNSLCEKTQFLNIGVDGTYSYRIERSLEG